MRRVDFEILLRRRHRVLAFAHHLHHAAHACGHELVRIDDRRGAVHQALGNAHLADLVGERFLEPFRERLRRVIGERAVFFRGVLEVQFRLLRLTQFLPVELVQVIHHELVPRVVEEKHLELALAKHLKIRAALRRRAIRREQAENFLLVRRHAFHVVRERRDLARLQQRGLESQQPPERLLVREIGGDAFLQKPLVFRIKFLIRRGILLRLFLEEFQETRGQHLVQLLQQRRVLHRLARDVQRQILAVHHALEEAQPVREQPLGLRLNQHLAAIQVYFGIHAPHAERLAVSLRHEQQRLNRQRRVRREMQPHQRRVVIVPDEFVKLVVFLVLDLVFAARPDRLERVEPVAVQCNRKRHETRIPLDDPLDRVAFRELLRVVLEFQRDLRAARQVRRRRDLVAARAVAHPLPARLARRRRTAVNRHALGHHERRIKPDAKLPDQPRVRPLILGQLLHERLRARVRDGAEILDQLRVRHPHARVGERDRARLVIRGEGNRRGRVRLLDRRARSLREPQLLARVRAVGNQLANEDFFVRVQRVNDDVQQLLNLGLEVMFFGCAHKGLFNN